MDWLVSTKTTDSREPGEEASPAFTVERPMLLSEALLPANPPEDVRLPDFTLEDTQCTAEVEPAPAQAALPEELSLVQSAIQLLTEKQDDQTVSIAVGKFEAALAITDTRNAEKLRTEASITAAKLEASGKALTADEQLSLLEKIQTLQQQADSISWVRLKYAETLSRLGHEKHDHTLKTKAHQLVESIRQADLHTFASNPAVRGSLLQIGKGQRIELSTAASETFLRVAVEHIPLHFPAVGTKEAEQRVVQLLAHAYANDPDGTQSRIDQTVRQGQGALREFGSDAGAVTVGFASKWLMSNIAPKLMNGHWSVKLMSLGGQLAVAGLTKDYLADGRLGTGSDWLRGAGLYAASGLLVKGMRSLDPTRQPLSSATSRAFELKYKLDSASLSGATRNSFAGGSAEALAQRLNPLNYNPLHRHVWSAEAAAQSLTRGQITMGQYFARTGAGRLYTTMGMSGLFAGGREALYIGTGQKRADGTDHDAGSAFADIADRAAQGAFFGALSSPFVGYPFRGLIPELSPISSSIGRWERAQDLRHLSARAKALVLDASAQPLPRR